MLDKNDVFSREEGGREEGSYRTARIGGERRSVWRRGNAEKLVRLWTRREEQD